MIKIRPVSELRNSFPKIEDLVVKQDEVVYLTKNGTGIMVVISIEKYSNLVKAAEENSPLVSKKSSRRNKKDEDSKEPSLNTPLLDENLSPSDIDNLWKKNDTL